MFQFYHHLQQPHQIPCLAPLDYHVLHNAWPELVSIVPSSKKKDHSACLLEPDSVLDLSAHISPMSSPTAATSASSSSTIFARSTHSYSSSNLGRSCSSTIDNDRASDISSFDEDYTFEWPAVNDGKLLLSNTDLEFTGNGDQKLLTSSTDDFSSCEQKHQQVWPIFEADPGGGCRNVFSQQHQEPANSSRIELSSGQVHEQGLTAEEDENLGLQIVHMLLACVDCIQQGNQVAACIILEQLAACTRSSLLLRSPLERVSGYISAALRERMNKGALFSEVGTFEKSNSNSEAADRAFYSHLPFLKFAHFTANQAILEAVAGCERIHIVDLDVGQGLQWPNFIQILASTSRTAATVSPYVSMRLTGVGTDREALERTGYRLKAFARDLGVALDFHAVVPVDSIDHLDLASAVPVEDGEVLAVSCSMVLHRMLANQPALERLLLAIRAWRPAVVTVAEIEANHNAPSFVDRFVEALHFYSALFDALDVTLPRSHLERAAIENTRFGREIRNILACEGAERIVRHARSDQWRDCMRWSGFKDVMPSHSCLYQAHLLLQLYHPPASYKITRDGSACILGWHQTPVISVSVWKCC